MIYNAQVLDNSNFIKNGTIRVRIDKFVFFRMKDLSEDPSQINEGMYYNENGDIKHSDTDVKVFSPLGGGKDFGMFFLPAVNTKGLVCMTGDPDGNSQEFVWMGGIFEKTGNSINVPSDSSINKEGISYGNSNLEVLDGALIIKLRSTKLEDQTEPEKSKDTLDWKKTNIENLVVMNKERILIHHNNYDDDNNPIGSSVIDLNKDKAGVSLNSDTSIGEISLDGTGNFSISNQNTESGTLTSIVSSGKEISHSVVSSKHNTVIIQGDDNINIVNDKSSIGISDDTINIKGKIVSIDADEIFTGLSGNRVVTCPVEIDAFALDNGIILTTSKTLRS